MLLLLWVWHQAKAKHAPLNNVQRWLEMSFQKGKPIWDPTSTSTHFHMCLRWRTFLLWTSPHGENKCYILIVALDHNWEDPRCSQQKKPIEQTYDCKQPKVCVKSKNDFAWSLSLVSWNSSVHTNTFRWWSCSP